jgi:hypothetical protein
VLSVKCESYSLVLVLEYQVCIQVLYDSRLQGYEYRMA